MRRLAALLRGLIDRARRLGRFSGADGAAGGRISVVGVVKWRWRREQVRSERCTNPNGRITQSNFYVVLVLLLKFVATLLEVVQQLGKNHQRLRIQFLTSRTK